MWRFGVLHRRGVIAAAGRAIAGSSGIMSSLRRRHVSLELAVNRSTTSSNFTDRRSPRGDSENTHVGERSERCGASVGGGAPLRPKHAETNPDRLT